MRRPYYPCKPPRPRSACPVDGGLSGSSISASPCPSSPCSLPASALAHPVRCDGVWHGRNCSFTRSGGAGADRARLRDSEPLLGFSSGGAVDELLTLDSRLQWQECARLRQNWPSAASDCVYTALSVRRLITAQDDFVASLLENRAALQHRLGEASKQVLEVDTDSRAREEEQYRLERIAQLEADVAHAREVRRSYARPPADDA